MIKKMIRIVVIASILYLVGYLAFHGIQGIMDINTEYQLMMEVKTLWKH